MAKTKIDAYSLLKRIREEKPIVHHLTNWVTIYDCANVVKTLGASPVMAHAREEAAEMAAIASSLVLNIGTLTPDFVEAMKIAAKSANKKGIPVILDICGVGATRLRDDKSLELLNEVKIDIIKGNVSEIVRASGENIRTRGVDSTEVEQDMFTVAGWLTKRFNAVVVVTGKHDIIRNGIKSYVVKNGHPMMTHVVGTGCMAASVIGAFAAVTKDLAYAAASALTCFEIAAELAAKKAKGPASFKEAMFDCLFKLEEKTINKMQKVTA
ncbi:MAG: hydroxyethylthiazole kinase [Candidatus Omnitrophica bacterium]|nr:hydroxyethylthiazole kinase [Candidatus Omnitrophota bacterium]